jgi:hypothetical protein
MKNILRASILVLALTGSSAFAGDIPNVEANKIPDDLVLSEETASTNTTMVEIITSIINLLPLP